MPDEKQPANSFRQHLREALNGELSERQAAEVILYVLRFCAVNGKTEVESDRKVYVITEVTIQCMREWSEEYQYSDPMFSVEIDQAIEEFRQRLEVDW